MGDRQNVKCGNYGALKKFRFERCDTDQAKYIYDCCTWKKSEVRSACTKKETNCEKGSGKLWELQYLAKLPVFCGKDEILQAFHFVPCKKINHAKYVFVCC